jgi:hypothetical protein
LGRTLPQLVLLRLRELYVLPHLRARRQLIPRLIRPVQRQPQRNLLQLRQHLLLQLPRHVPALRLLHQRRDLACPCDLRRQHPEARLREHVRRQQRLGLRVLLAHLQLCNVIHRVRARQVLRRGNHVPVRRKACARLVERHNNIVQAVRRRVVLAVRRGSVLVDRLRDSRNAPAAVVDRVAATIKDRSAHSVPAQEFPRRSQASRSMRASPRRAVGR